MNHNVTFGFILLSVSELKSYKLLHIFLLRYFSSILSFSNQDLKLQTPSFLSNDVCA